MYKQIYPTKSWCFYGLYIDIENPTNEMRVFPLKKIQSYFGIKRLKGITPFSPVTKPKNIKLTMLQLWVCK